MGSKWIEDFWLWPKILPVPKPLDSLLFADLRYVFEILVVL